MILTVNKLCIQEKCNGRRPQLSMVLATNMEGIHLLIGVYVSGRVAEGVLCMISDRLCGKRFRAHFLFA